MTRDWPEDRPVVSPCIGVCVMDAASGCCKGCQRTIEEIAGWPNFDRAARIAVLERVAERRRNSPNGR